MLPYLFIPGEVAVEGGRLCPPAGHASAACQKLRHDPACGTHACLSENFSIMRVCAFADGPGGQFALALCQIDVAFLP